MKTKKIFNNKNSYKKNMKKTSTIKVSKNNVIFNNEVFNKQKLNNTLREIVLNELCNQMVNIENELDCLKDAFDYIYNKKDLFENCKIYPQAIDLNTNGNIVVAFDNAYETVIANKLQLYCSGNIIKLLKVA